MIKKTAYIYIDGKLIKLNKYEVDELGNVYSLKTQKIMKQKITNCGYLSIGLYVYGKRRDLYVHRIVASTFLENKDPINLKVVNHKDSNKQNNRVYNLEWTDQSSNINHSVENGTNGRTKFTKKEIRYIRENYKAKSKEFGAKALSKKFNCGVRTIIAIVRYESYKNI